MSRAQAWETGATNQTWPDVSVIVPTRDRPQLLMRALKSILGQGYAGQIECIVVFDHSEASLPPIESPEGRHLRILVNDRTPGPAGARNTGVLASTGDLLAFCDDDDEWIADKVYEQVRVLDRKRDADVVACGVIVQSGRRATTRLPDQTITLRHLLQSRTIQAHFSTVMVRRSAFVDEIGLIDETFPGSYAEDFDWMLRAASLKDIEAVPRPLVRLYWHRSSFFDTRWELMGRALQKILAKHPELQEDRRGLARVYGRLAFAKAACGSKEARSLALRAFSLDWRQPRAYLALLVSTGLVGPNSLLRLTQRFGRGI